MTHKGKCILGVCKSEGLVLGTLPVMHAAAATVANVISEVGELKFFKLLNTVAQ